MISNSNRSDPVRCSRSSPSLRLIAALAAHIEHPPRSSPRLAALARAPRSRRPRYRLRAGYASLPRHPPHAPLAPRRRDRARRRVRRRARRGAALRRPARRQRAQRRAAGSTAAPAPCACGSPATPSGRLVYLLEVPERAGEAAAHGARAAYEGVELRAGRGGAGAAKQAGARASRRCCAPSWCSPARASSRWPGSALEPDPLQPFAAAIGRAAPRAGSAASVCVDLLPASGLRARSPAAPAAAPGRAASTASAATWRRCSTANERRRGRPDPDGAGRAPRGRCRRSTRSCATPASCSRRRSCLRCEAPSKRAGEAGDAGLLAAFRPLRRPQLPARLGPADPRHRLPRLRLPAAAARLRPPLRHRPLPARAQRRSSPRASWPGFLKPPTVHCGARERRCARARCCSPPPDAADLRGRPGRPDPARAGQHARRASASSASAPPTPSSPTSPAARATARPRRRSPSSSTWSGPGTAASSSTPTATRLERIEPYLRRGGGERVVRDRPRPRRLAGRPAGLEPLRARRRTPRRAEARVEAIVDAFASALEWGERSTRAINLTTQAAAALAAIAGAARPELAPTIFQIPTLLSDAEWRRGGAAFPAARRRSASGPTASRCSPPRRSRRSPTWSTACARSTPITALLGQSQSTYRVREAMDEGKIVLACPGDGRHPRPAGRQPAALRPAARRARPGASWRPRERKPFWVFLDEVQSYDGAASGNLAALLGAEREVRAAGGAAQPEPRAAAAPRP